MKILLILSIVLAFEASACDPKDHLVVAQKYAERESDKGSTIQIQRVGLEFHYTASLQDKEYSSESSGAIKVVKGPDGNCEVKLIRSANQFKNTKNGTQGQHNTEKTDTLSGFLSGNQLP